MAYHHASDVTVWNGQQVIDNLLISRAYIGPPTSGPPDTQAPTIPTNVQATVTSQSTITVTWTAATDNVGVTAYRLTRNGTVLSASPAGTSYQDTGLSPSTLYTYTVAALDGAGNVSGQSLAASATTLAPDVVPPVVSLTAPLPGATVLGPSVPVNATASDNVAVVGVQFLLDGSPLGSEDLTSPYGLTWDTTLVANGGHTLSARARDMAGALGTAAGVSVTVTNPAPPPTTTVTFDNPAPPGASGSLLSGVFQGLDFGSGQWRWESAYNVNPTNHVYFDSTSGTSRTLRFSPSPRILTSVRVFTSTNAGTLTLSDDAGDGDPIPESWQPHARPDRLDQGGDHPHGRLHRRLEPGGG